MATTYNFIENVPENRWELRQFESGDFQRKNAYAKGEVMLEISATAVNIIISADEKKTIPVNGITAPAFIDLEDLKNQLAIIVY